MFNVRSVTKSIKDLIYQLSFIYNLDDDQNSNQKRIQGSPFKLYKTQKLILN